MRGVLRALVVLQVLLPIATSAAEEKVSVQLNSVENADNRCRLYFVIENKSQVGIESMKLDLIAFGGDGGRLRIRADPWRRLRRKHTTLKSVSMRDAWITLANRCEFIEFPDVAEK
jgi:hypothetical protein